MFHRHGSFSFSRNFFFFPSGALDVDLGASILNFEKSFPRVCVRARRRRDI